MVLFAFCLAVVPARGQAPPSSPVFFRRIKSFGFPDLTATNPASTLVEGADGALYGTARGGRFGGGTLFKMAKDGNGLAVLHGFGNQTDGRDPSALTKGRDGWLYGTTGSGGVSGSGTVFKIRIDGTGYTRLKDFSGDADGGRPAGGVLEASDGGLYGTSAQASRLGAMFKVDKDGSNFMVLRMFSATDDPKDPNGGLIEGPDGALYGTSARGGSADQGTVFRIRKDGSQFSVLHSFSASFNGPHGGYPAAGLVDGLDGYLYGTTFGSWDPPYAGSTIFRIRYDGGDYSEPKDPGPSSFSPLLLGTDGNLYGTSPALPGTFINTVFRVGRDGGGWAMLHQYVTWGDIDTQVRDPRGGLLETAGGVLYGTTYEGGLYGDGTAFRINVDGGGYATVQNFSRTGNDGLQPVDLIEGPDGRLYGVTGWGGRGHAGTVYSLNKDGSGYRILHEFTQDRERGPRVLIAASDGLLYGTAGQVGEYTTNQLPTGMIFRMERDGSGYTPLHGFGGSNTDGRIPYDLLEGQDGALYGTTHFGGEFGSGTIFGGDARGGTVFTLSKDGSGYRILHSFGQGNDGSDARRLLQASDGMLYGTTSWGGVSTWGTIFRLRTNGSDYAVLHQFALAPTDGRMPNSLLERPDGFLYGATDYGGPSDMGTIFRLGRDGSSFTILHSPTRLDPRGAYPRMLVEGRDGKFYGLADGGVLYRIDANGNNYELLWQFGWVAGGGRIPTMLMQAANGVWYGTTQDGGDLEAVDLYTGVLFSLDVTSVVLRAERARGSVVISWPATISTDTLQSASTLEVASGWTAVSTEPVLNGARWEVALPAPSASRFYRVERR
jgi:uncharacterized repeat protein (TIGR03803 family)